MDTANRREIALVVGVVFAVAAIAAGNPKLFAWSVGVLGLAGGATWWARFAWRAVTIEAAFEPPRAFVGEPVTLMVVVRNHKRVPIPVLSVGAWLPPGLFPANEDPSDDGVGYRGLWLPRDLAPREVSSAIRGYRRRLFLGARSEARLAFPVRVAGRGEYWVRRIEVQASDPFELVPVVQEMTPDAALLVMPEPRVALPASVRRRLPFGVPVRAARIFEERERFAGVRAYEAGDPLNRIHWRLTGHAGELQTKLFEPTRGADVLFALDLAVGEPFWDAVYPEIAEDTIGWASFLCRTAFESGWRVGLVANTHLTRGRGPLRIPSSLARGHEGAVFAALARMPNEPTADMGPVLREAGRRLGHETTVVLITPRPGPRLRQEVARLRGRGTAVVELSPLSDARAGAGA
ncbi:MAG TPA: DUF58 domain-containing protein [Actinomycetota bacterium]